MLFCLIYEDEKRLPIGEVRGLAGAEHIVQKLWNKFGVHFHRGEPTSRSQYHGDGARLDELLHDFPVHALDSNTNKPLCGAKAPYDALNPSAGAACQFCLAVQVKKSPPNRFQR
jgi:hypothetical protein